MILGQQFQKETLFLKFSFLRSSGWWFHALQKLSDAYTKILLVVLRLKSLR